MRHPFRSRAHRRRLPAIAAFVTAAAMITAGGCASSFEESHFFKSVDADGKAVNYYRVKVDGGTFLSSSRYVSGYYDETVLDAYFNTMTQPKNGAIKPEEGKGDGE